jgi:drug/metabolite transporter (DMT)-like permease
VPLIGVTFFRRRVTPAQLAALAVSYCAVLCVFGREVSLTGSNVPLGATLVFLSAIAYSVYLVCSGEVVRRLGALRLTALVTTVCTFAPVLMVMMAIERIGATLTAQAGTIGLLSTILMAVVILGEPFTPWIAAGTALVLLGIWLLTSPQA